jgi:hypothetical protein
MGSLLPCALQGTPRTSKVWAGLREYLVHEAVIFYSCWRSGCHSLILEPIQTGLFAKNRQNIENSG